MCSAVLSLAPKNNLGAGGEVWNSRSLRMVTEIARGRGFKSRPVHHSKRRLAMQAIVYIRTDPGKALALLDKIKNLPGVKFAAATAGRFDIVARIEAADIKTLGDAVVGKIQGIPGIRYTETSLIVA